MNKVRQQGVAVITAILVVALVASTAAYLAWQNQLRLRQMENRQALAQADAASRAAIDWARAVLLDDARSNTTDNLNEPWATVVPGMAADGGEVGGRIVDQQGLFNLNNLTQAPDVARFRRLLAALELPGELAEAAADWIDSDGAVRYPGGAEDGDYLSLDPPYRAANRPMADVAELYRVKGFGRETVERLQPFVTALPAATRINLNTAPAEVLAATVEGGAPEDAQAILAARQKRPFDGWQDFEARLPKVAQRTPQDAVGFASQFFLAETLARFGGVSARWQALLWREGQTLCSIVWQKQL